MRMQVIMVIGIAASLVWLAAACSDDDDDNDDPNIDAGAPYIYLYPEEAQEVSVTLIPAEGCWLTHTDPAYDDGWTFWAEPSGLLDGQYDYLYYTASVHFDFQLDQGWAVPGEDVFTWFANTLPEFGFSADEVGDFLDYWTVHLPDAACYSIYPQTNAPVDNQIALEVIPEPDTVFRLWLVIVLGDYCDAVVENPTIMAIDRQGFTVVEWGVVLY